MLESLTVINTAGLVLYQDTLLRNNIDLINDLIQNYILPQRQQSEIIIGQFRFYYEKHNDLGLVFVAFHSVKIQLEYVPKLLESLKSQIQRIYIKGSSYLSREKTRDLVVLITGIVNQKAKNVKPKDFKDSKKYQSTLKGSNQVINSSGNDEITAQIDATLEQLDSGVDGNGDGDNEQKMNDLRVLDSRLVNRRTQKVPRPFQKKTKDSKETAGKGSKQGRAWDASGYATIDTKEQLDFSSQDQESGNGIKSNTALVGNSLGKTINGLYDAQDLAIPKKKPQSSIFSQLFTNFTTGKELSATDLKDPILKMKEHLIKKNVSSQVAQSITDSVKSNLLGTKLTSLQSIDSTIKSHLSTQIAKILSPGVTTNLVQEIKTQNADEKIYSICFIGVNGVGKSTNLSKVCFWLLQNKFKVLIAACDTFRSGAVEQLRVHVQNLGQVQGGFVELFDRGYGKDPAGIAKEAIAYGERNGFNVVLIDTAGRMQDNEPLMRALTKVITLNNPNKIIFVGEALVGNEGLSQITKFNQSLKDFSHTKEYRGIDGMILTKFDTVDDKVGSAVTMCYCTGKPIFFVGDGQTYTDLRKLNVDAIVELLMQQ